MEVQIKCTALWVLCFLYIGECSYCFKQKQYSIENTSWSEVSETNRLDTINRSVSFTSHLTDKTERVWDAPQRTEIDLSGSLIYTGEKHPLRSAEPTTAGLLNQVFMQPNVTLLNQLSKRIRRQNKHQWCQLFQKKNIKRKIPPTWNHQWRNRMIELWRFNTSSDLLYHTPSVNTENTGIFAKALILIGRVWSM